MNQATAVTLIAIQGAGLVITIGLFGTALFVALKAKKELEAKLAKAEQYKLETQEFLRRISSI